MVTKGVTVDLEALRQELRKAKEEERPNRVPSLREAVKVLLPEIDGLRRARWSDAQIAEWLGKRGLNISPGTLAQYMREARKSGPVAGSEAKPKRSAKEAMGDGPKASANDGEARTAHKPETPANTGRASAAAEIEEKPQHHPEPDGARTGLRAPNPAAAIPTKRRVNDDA